MNYAQRAITIHTLSHFMYGAERWNYMTSLYEWLWSKQYNNRRDQ